LLPWQIEQCPFDGSLGTFAAHHRDAAMTNDPLAGHCRHKQAAEHHVFPEFSITVFFAGIGAISASPPQPSMKTVPAQHCLAQLQQLSVSKKKFPARGRRLSCVKSVKSGL
jgi:hypothetical protein